MNFLKRLFRKNRRIELTAQDYADLAFTSQMNVWYLDALIRCLSARREFLRGVRKKRKADAFINKKKAELIEQKSDLARFKTLSRDGV